MDPDQIFRHFFGTSFPEFDQQRFRPGTSRDTDESMGENHHGRDLFDDLHRHMQQQMEEMDRHMQGVFRIFSMPPGTVPMVPQLPDGSAESQPPPGSSPRDYMMKEGEGASSSADMKDQPSVSISPRPFFGGIFSPRMEPFTGYPQNRIPLEDRKDSDLDSRNPSSDDIVGLLEKREQPSTSPFSSFTFSGSSISKQTVVGPNGTVEERSTVKDSNGCTKETITRRIGDSSHTITTITDQDGRQERRETVNNADRDEFSKMWEGRSLGPGSIPAITGPDTPVPNPGLRGGVLSDNNRSIFRKFFGF